MRIHRIAVVSVACAAAAMSCAMPAFGQARDDLQPGVNTSATPAQPAAPASHGKTAKAATTAKAPAPGAGGKADHPAKAMDHLELGATQITGNRELPKVMYVVPWKHSDLGDLTGKPANSLIDEVLQPVDRDVFNREERYYHTVAAQKSTAEPAPGAPPAH